MSWAGRDARPRDGRRRPATLLGMELPALMEPVRAGTRAPAIALRGLTKRFGVVTAVDGLDLTVEPGEIVAFLGPNGAGKTSTIDVLLGLSRPDGGTAEVFGVAPRTAVAHGLVTAV